MHASDKEEHDPKKGRTKINKKRRKGRSARRRLQPAPSQVPAELEVLEPT